MEKISVIIPIHNAAAYIEQTVRSVMEQTYPHLEILLINDDSTDDTARICEQLKTSDSRIRLYHRRNGHGVGDTRNFALSLVTGDYISFIDHDDLLENNSLEILYHLLKKHDSDIAIGNFTSYYEDRREYGYHMTELPEKETLYSVSEWFKKQYESEQCFSQCFTVPWGKLYKRSLFDTIQYPISEPVEDDYTTYKVYLMADKISYLHQSIVIHRKYPESITGSVSQTAVFPLKSIEERITLLSLAGMDISEELKAYEIRLAFHRDYLLKTGQMNEYNTVIGKLAIIEKYK